ncbi:MAG: hypothetical protein L6Q98_06355 [Anaerolineae bacterium]|nr:hypothetical protein [Anaerolineae bacterium]NUQ02804.1 hypothetical protein [Anaerolineae bacterium]
MQRDHLLQVAAILPVIAVVLLLVFSAIPTQTAQACLPCNCTDIRSLNCFGPYHLYTPTSGDDCSIDLWLFEGDKGSRYIRMTSAQLARYAEFPTENLLLRERGVIALYKLTTGEYQVNVGPDAEHKVYVINFTGCPAENIYESNFVQGQ